MDHLAQFPAGSDVCETKFQSHFEERVPFVVVRSEYSVHDFYGILDGQLEKLQKDGPDTIHQTPLHQEIPQFLQSWLFFALLSLFLGADIDAQDFTCEQSQYVTTASLPSRLRQWREIVEKETFEERENRAILIDTALNDASHFVTMWYREDFSWKVPRKLWLSFAILGETLNCARLKALPSTGSGGWQSLDDRQWGESKIMKSDLQQRGWCPNTIRNLQGTVGNLSGLFVISRLGPPSGSHGSCTDQECMAHSEDGMKFPIHTKRCKERTRDELGYGCPSLKVPEVRVAKILQEGNIPLVYLDRKRANDYGKSILQECIEVRAFRLLSESHSRLSRQISASIGSGMSEQTLSTQHCPRYVAISHVWSDGLGNNIENALPQCQFLELQDMVNELQKNEEKKPNTPFWLDTLCIPLKPDIKKIGIRGMNKVYENSDKVLVLDNDLQQFEQHNGLEPLIRINTSKWVTRLWTLQEGSLSKNLFFRFKYGRFLSTRNIEERFEEAEKNLHLSWLKTARIFSPTIKSLRNRDEKHKVAHLWQAVQGRKTSREQDETVCLSTLLGIDPQPLLDPTDTTEQKMCRFLSMLDRYVGIPPGMIFLPGSKLDEHGFGWAPKTWMSGKGECFPYPLYSDDISPSFLMRDGLLVQYPGIELTFETVPNEKIFMFPRSLDYTQWYRVEYVGDTEKYTAFHTPRSKMDLDKLAIILSRSEFSSFPEVALLVSITSARDGVIWAHYCCRVWISLESDSDEKKKMVSRFKAQKNSIRGKFLPKTQRWCVDKPMVRSHIRQLEAPR